MSARPCTTTSSPSKHGGTFLLRIEDTDRTRFVPGAEEYIKEVAGLVRAYPR